VKNNNATYLIYEILADCRHPHLFSRNYALMGDISKQLNCLLMETVLKPQIIVSWCLALLQPKVV